MKKVRLPMFGGTAVGITLLRTLSLALSLALWLATSTTVLADWHRGRRPGYRAQSTPGLTGKNMIGGRLGPWFADGLSAEFASETVRVVSSSTAFHLEFFYLYHLTGPLYLDFNLGTVSRADLRFVVGPPGNQHTAIGTAGLYPFGFGLQLFPLAAYREVNLQPFISAGGSFIMGTETLSHYSNSSGLGYYLGYSQKSRVAIGWYAGGGLDLVLGRSFALTLGGKYQHAKFDKELVGVKDYSGFQVLIGGAYLYH